MIPAVLDKFLIIIFFATCLQGVTSLHGYPCNSEHSRMGCDPFSEICKDFKCQCKEIFGIFYYNGVAECKFSFWLHGYNFYRADDSCKYGCPAEYTCQYGKCVCKEPNNIPVENKCYEPVIQGLKEKCYISDKAYICNATANIHCSNGSCECFPNFYYNETAKKCLTSFKNLSAEHCFMSCRDDQKCVKSKCVCQNETYVEIKKICTAAIMQSPMEECYTSDRAAYICNETEYTYCKSHVGRCLCLQDYYYNETVKECLSKKSYTDFYGIKEYRALPGGYCVHNTECIDGLHCSSFKCHCPKSCPYNKDSVCKICGKVEFETRFTLSFIGIFLGIIVVLYWFLCIKLKNTMIKIISNPRTVFVSVPVTELHPVPLSRPSREEEEPVPLSWPSREDDRPSNEDLPPSYDEAMINCNQSR